MRNLSSTAPVRNKEDPTLHPTFPWAWCKLTTSTPLSGPVHRKEGKRTKKESKKNGKRTQLRNDDGRATHTGPPPSPLGSALLARLLEASSFEPGEELTPESDKLSHSCPSFRNNTPLFYAKNAVFRTFSRARHKKIVSLQQYIAITEQSSLMSLWNLQHNK